MNNELTREQKLRIKAQEVIDLLKEYLPEYKETLDLYNPDRHLMINEIWEEYEIGEFDINIYNKRMNYILEISNHSIYKLSEEADVLNYICFVNKEDLKIYKNENPWTWDDAIEVIKKRLEMKI